MKITGFEWDDGNEGHIVSRHGIWPEDVEELFTQKHYVRRTCEDKYLVYGRTSVGRYLLVVMILKAKGIVRVITARDMTDTEKKLYRKKVKP